LTGSDNKDAEEDKLSWAALEYIGEVTANAKCPFCSNETWVYAHNERGAPRRALMSYRGPTFAHVVPAVALVCDNCGYIRYHDLAMIKTKLDERESDD
jgi:ribosomal protein S27AE